VNVRNLEQFPNDENGDVLWRMKQSGDNLSKAREIDFWAVFKSKESAIRLALQLLELGEKVSCTPNESELFPWQTGVHPVMVPDYRIITEFEEKLGANAKELDGELDGWGCEQK
jgi:hypothetical protein